MQSSQATKWKKVKVNVVGQGPQKHLDGLDEEPQAGRALRLCQGLQLGSKASDCYAQDGERVVLVCRHSATPEALQKGCAC